MKNKKKKALLVAVAVLLSVCTLLTSSLFALNILVYSVTSDKIYTPSQFNGSNEYDCILVLGAGIRNGQPSDVLRDRLTTAIDLYSKGAAPKLLMSGDHGNDDYDEVGVMMSFALEQGVPAEDIFLDHAGFSTYDSVYRANKLFEASSMIVVTQKYHLPRALYICQSLGVSAIGVSADIRTYSGQMWRDMREFAARPKDCLKCLFKPCPQSLDGGVPINGNGSSTHTKNT